MIARRSLLAGLGLLAAPAIIRTPGLLMPVRRVRAFVPGPEIWEEHFYAEYFRANRFARYMRDNPDWFIRSPIIAVRELPAVAETYEDGKRRFGRRFLPGIRPVSAA